MDKGWGKREKGKGRKEEKEVKKGEGGKRKKAIKKGRGEERRGRKVEKG